MIQGNPDTIYDFLLNADDEFPIELGKLDLENGKEVDRDADGRVINNSNNRELYRENGIDNIVKIARSFNLGKKQGSTANWGIVDEEDNLFAETVFRPVAETFFSALPDTYGPDVAEILIQNSGRADECMDQILDPEQDPPDPFIGGLSESDRETLTECYMSRVFQAIAVRGLVKTFPVRTDPDGGTPVPIFNILPKNSPSNFSQVFVSNLIPAQTATVFKDISFTVQNLNADNRFVWTMNPNDNLESKLQSVFSPRATANENVNDQNIDFNFPDVTTKGSTGALIFEATMGFDGNAFNNFEVEVDAGQGDLAISEKVSVKWGKNAYVNDKANDIVVHDFDTDSTFDLAPTESASFDAFTVDNDEQGFDIQMTNNPVTTPEDLVDLFNNELDSDYVEFETSGNDKVIASGDAYYFDYESPFKDITNSVDPVTVTINLQIFVPGNNINSLSASGGESFQSTSDEKILRDAPFFDVENNEDWMFISREVAAPPQDIENIDVEAKKFDPDLGLDDAPDPIVDKALNDGYQGFGARAMNYEQDDRQDVEESESLLGDFYRFFKDYVETNYRVVHVGLSQSTPPTPIASVPQPLTIELDRYDA